MIHIYQPESNNTPEHCRVCGKDENAHQIIREQIETILKGTALKTLDQVPQVADQILSLISSYYIPRERVEEEIVGFAVITRVGSQFIDFKEHKEWAESHQKDTLDCIVVPAKVVFSAPSSITKTNMKNKQQKDTKECCYQSVFEETAVRVGRCSYSCNHCGHDVSMLWAFYMLAKHDAKK